MPYVTLLARELRLCWALEIGVPRSDGFSFASWEFISRNAQRMRLQIRFTIFSFNGPTRQKRRSANSDHLKSKCQNAMRCPTQPGTPSLTCRWLPAVPSSPTQ